MRSFHVNFVNTTNSETGNTCGMQEINIEKDPFLDVNQDVEPSKYYRLNEKVFAEPLNICNANKITMECIKESPSQSDLIFVGNIGVEKRPGKRKKYFIDLDVTNLTCPQQNCQRVFTSATLLKAHVRKVHCADRAFVCDRCGARFTARYLLKRHEDVHGNRKVKCNLCGKMLSARTNLSTHMRSHSGERPHICPCGKRFVRKSALNRHEKHVHK